MASQVFVVFSASCSESSESGKRRRRRRKGSDVLISGAYPSV